MGNSAIIKSNRLFENVAIEKIDFNDINFSYENYEAGTVIYRRKTKAENLFLIAEGKVAIIKPDGKEILGENDFFGASVIDNENYNEISVCEDDCSLIKIPKQELEKLIAVDKQIEENIKNALINKSLPEEETKEECPPCPEIDCPEYPECPEEELPENILTFEQTAEKISNAILDNTKKSLEIISQIEETNEDPQLVELEKHIRKIYEQANLSSLFINEEEFSEKKTNTILDLINEYLEKFSLEYSFYKCEIKIEKEESFNVNVDRKKLYEAVKQILLNSCEATNFEGKIAIEISSDADYVEVRFTDNGSGIPPERALDVFEPFVSFDKNHLGLGLAVADKIITEQNGKITVKQGSEGGSIAIFLPIVNDE